MEPVPFRDITELWAPYLLYWFSSSFMPPNALSSLTKAPSFEIPLYWAQDTMRRHYTHTHTQVYLNSLFGHWGDGKMGTLMLWVGYSGWFHRDLVHRVSTTQSIDLLSPHSSGETYANDFIWCWREKNLAALDWWHSVGLRICLPSLWSLPKGFPRETDSFHLMCWPSNLTSV